MIGKMKGSSTSVFSSGFIGTKIIYSPSEEQIQDILKITKEYVDDAIAESGHLTEIVAAENSGLKVIDKNKIDFDDEVEFVIDANE